MERGAINGIPVWIKILELTGSERTVIKEAPGVDGAIIETQGQQPQRYRVEFMLIQDGAWITDDYETASLDLRTTLLAGGPFALTAPTFGEVTDLWLESSGYTIKFFDESRLSISEGSLTFVEGRPIALLQEDAIANVETSITGLTEAAALDFDRRVPDEGLFDNAISVLEAIGDWLANVQDVINAAFQPINDLSGEIAIIRGGLQALLNAPQNFAARLNALAAALLGLIPSLSRQGDPRKGSAAVQDTGNDKPAATFVEALGLGEDFDSGVPVPTVFDPPSDEDLAEADESAAARSLSYTAITASVCLAITTTEFATANSVLNVGDALEPVFELLFALDNLDYRVYNQSRSLRAATRQFLSEQAASLPRLRSIVTDQVTDPFDLLPDLYDDLDSIDQVQAAVDSIMSLNTLGSTIDIQPGTTILYLTPLVA